MTAANAELVLHFERGRLGAGAYPGKDAIDPFHTDVAVFGALQVSAGGDLANEDGGPELRDLDFEGAGVVVMMEHTDWRGRPRIVSHCSLPVIGRSCVDRIIDHWAMFKAIRFDLNLVVAGDDGEHVAIVYQSPMTLKDDTKVDVGSMEIFRVVAGKITEVWNCGYKQGVWT